MYAYLGLNGKWWYNFSIYQNRALKYADFEGLEGKTAEDVARIDDVVNLYKEKTLSMTNIPDTWESRHLLTDGLLVIKYNTNKNHLVEEVIFNENFDYTTGVLHPQTDEPNVINYRISKEDYFKG